MLPLTIPTHLLQDLAHQLQGERALRARSRCPGSYRICSPSLRHQAAGQCVAHFLTGIIKFSSLYICWKYSSRTVLAFRTCCISAASPPLLILHNIILNTVLRMFIFHSTVFTVSISAFPLMYFFFLFLFFCLLYLPLQLISYFLNHCNSHCLLFISKVRYFICHSYLFSIFSSDD
jgi:hypothetical protein